MLHELYNVIENDYFIWALFGLCYVFQSARLIGHDEFIFVFSPAKITGIFSVSDYTIFGKRTLLKMMFMPGACAFDVNWYPIKIVNVKKRSLHYLLTLHNCLCWPKAISYGSIFLFLLVGPILTYLINLTVSFQVILPLYFILILISLFFLKRSSLWKRLGKRRKNLFLESFFWPPTSMLIVRKILDLLPKTDTLFSVFYQFGEECNQKLVFRNMLIEAEEVFDVNEKSEELVILKKKV